MPLDTAVGLGPGNIVLDEDPALPRKGAVVPYRGLTVARLSNSAELLFRSGLEVRGPTEVGDPGSMNRPNACHCVTDSSVAAMTCNNKVASAAAAAASGRAERPTTRPSGHSRRAASSVSCVAMSSTPAWSTTQHHVTLRRAHAPA